MSELEQSLAAVGTEHQSYLFYGPYGTGKTSMAAKMHHKRKLWCDVDRKLESLENLTEQDRKNIK